MNRKQIPNTKESIRKGIAIPCGDAFVLLKQVTFRFYSFSFFKQADTAEDPQNGDGNIHKPKITHRIGEYDSQKNVIDSNDPVCSSNQKDEVYDTGEVLQAVLNSQTQKRKKYWKFCNSIDKVDHML